jgi:hypothetical protein
VAIILVCLAWLAGIALGSWFKVPAAAIALGLLPLPMIAVRRWR